MKDVTLKEVRPVGNAVFHHLHVLRVEGRCPDVVLVGEPVEEVARARGTVPDVVLLLPVLAQHIGKVLLREFHPLAWGEERALALPYVLRHKEVAAVNDIRPILLAWGALVETPELGVGALLVLEKDL